jgi:hypothetical protein
MNSIKYRNQVELSFIQAMKYPTPLLALVGACALILSSCTAPTASSGRGYSPSTRYIGDDEGPSLVSRSSGSTRKLGNSYYHSDGSYSRRLGNSFYHSDGSSSRVLGNSIYNSDGSHTRKLGNTYYHSDGSTSRVLGNSIYHSDGSVSRRLGNSWYTD